MDKIKLIYDVIKTMKEKDIFNGTFKVEGEKDQIKVVSFVNKFEKNLATGQVKAEINSKVDCEGNSLKHQSKTEMNLGSNHRNIFARLKHRHHHAMAKCGGFKSKLNKLTFFLKLLNDMEINKEDNNKILSVEINELPEGMKEHFYEKMNHKLSGHHLKHECFIKEVHTIEDANFALKLVINANNEIEIIKANIVGEYKDKADEKHEMNLQVLLELDS